MQSPLRTAKRRLYTAFSSAKKDCEGPKKTKIMSSPEVERVNVAEVHESVLEKVKASMASFSSSSDPNDPIARMIPVLVTAVSVAVGEVVMGVVKDLEDRLTKKLVAAYAPHPSQERLMAAVRRLTYENDRLQQYTRRDSVRVFGIPSATGETAEQAEEKALKVFKDAGAHISKDDIAVAHRAGREHRGSRPILVKFVSRRQRNVVMKAKKSLKSKEEYKRVFVNDDITPLRARLLAYIKKLEGVGSAYTVDGRIYVNKPSPLGLRPADRPKPVIVETPDDLFRLGVTRVDYAALGLGHLMESVEEEGVSVVED